VKVVLCRYWERWKKKEKQVTLQGRKGGGRFKGGEKRRLPIKQKARLTAFGPRSLPS
jgi:hypothetical protein